MQRYLFVLCPPYSGSTVLWKLLGTSDACATLSKEGQFLDSVSAIMRDEPWSQEKVMPWPEIKEKWLEQWDTSKPLLLEKSPPNIMRAGQIASHFQPISFIAMIRDPYAVSEGLRRRNGTGIEDAARFWVQCAQYQKHNIENLEHILWFTYEQLVEEPVAISDKIIRFLPELNAIDPGASFKVHSVHGNRLSPITNFNQDKIDKLSNSDIKIISKVLQPESKLLDFFGYPMRYPSANHGRRHFVSQMGSFKDTIIKRWRKAKKNMP